VKAGCSYQLTGEEEFVAEKQTLERTVTHLSLTKYFAIIYKTWCYIKGLGLKNR